MDILDIIQRFVVILYCRTSELDSVNEARKQLFCRGSRTLENIPLSEAALLQHCKRATYEGGHVWGNALTAGYGLPEPSDWGWCKTYGTWLPYWTDLP